jgi:ribose transport system permease protein
LAKPEVADHLRPDKQGASGRRWSLRRGYVELFRRSEGWTGIGAVLVVIVLALAIVEPDFRTSSNIWNVLRANAIPIVMACGMTFVILARGIDLSVGAMLALVMMILGEVLVHGWPGFVAVPAVICAGLGLGLLNGLLIGKVKINFFVVTLGTSIIFRSGSLLVTNGLTIQLYGRDNFALAGWLGDHNIGSVPVPAIVAAVVFTVSWAVLRWTVFGRSVYAVGGNPEAARVAGIPVDRIQVVVYAISGLLVGLAAVMYTGRISSATPQTGTGLELQVIAAVLLGGVSFTGGSGSVVGALMGALLIAVINNGLDLLHVSSFWQGVVTGAILIFADFLDRFRRTA